VHWVLLNSAETRAETSPPTLMASRLAAVLGNGSDGIGFRGATTFPFPK